MPAKCLSKTFFDSRFDEKRNRSILTDICFRIEEQCGTPLVSEISAGVRAFLAEPSLSGYKHVMSFDPLQSESSHEAYSAFQLQALIKKNTSFDLGIDLKKVALDTFNRSEVLCHSTNKKLRDRDDPDYQERVALIHSMQRKISLCLGPCPSWDDITPAFGPGTNIGCSKNTSVRFKLNAPATATELAGRSFAPFATNFHAWPGLLKPQAVRGSRWTSVPKTSLTDRGINVEPVINSYLQLGVGKAIRQRLKRVGVNLSDQTLNQRLARKGSLDGSLATIDLSMASDTISYLLVMDLLPYDWFVLLDTIRSPECQMPDGSWRLLEKFSSMGNGATFEVESLIFWAMLRAVCGDESEISVYGDDLIVPASKYNEVCRAIALLGFLVNGSKSFYEGSFRESCGKDYWDGVDIRPLFVTGPLSVKEMFRLHNFAMRTGRLDFLPDLCVRNIPRSFQTFGPDGYGDGHLIWDSAPRPSRDKRGWEPFHVISTFAAKPRTVRFLSGTYSPLDDIVDYGAFLYARANGLPDSERSALDGLYDVRSSTPKYRRVNIRVPGSN